MHHNGRLGGVINAIDRVHHVEQLPEAERAGCRQSVVGPLGVLKVVHDARVAALGILEAKLATNEVVLARRLLQLCVLLLKELNAEAIKGDDPLVVTVARIVPLAFDLCGKRDRQETRFTVTDRKHNRKKEKLLPYRAPLAS